MKNPSSYLKMKVLGAIEASPGKTQRERIKHVSELIFTDEDGNTRQFTWRTIQTWWYRFKIHGVTGIEASPRRDKGKPRKTSPEEVLEAINAALPHFRQKRYNRSDIYRFCLEKGLFAASQLSRTSFYRFIREYDLLNTNPEETNKRRMAFAMQYANQLWQADTMFGPYLMDKKSNRKVQAKLIAFIDDASRVLCHGEFFFEENTAAMIKAIRSAFYKRGVPEQLYVDNGSIYSGAEITLICARVGCVLRHTPVRDGAAKGKIERFFRRVRDQFLNRNLDLSSLNNLNRQFTTWVEDQYNASNHSAISMKPIDRFGMDLNRIKYLNPSEANDELFFCEEEREVKKDNTFSFKNTRYETPVDLRGKTITLRFDRALLDRIIIYYKGDRMGEAKELNLIANGQLRRAKYKKKPETNTHFSNQENK